MTAIRIIIFLAIIVLTAELLSAAFRTLRHYLNKYNYSDRAWVWWYRNIYLKYLIKPRIKRSTPILPNIEKIDIVIGFMNKPKETIRCIESLVNGYKNHLILADCASESAESSKIYDHIENDLSDNFEVSKIYFDRIVGVPKTYNEALKSTKHKYVLFIHNDMEVLAPLWQEKILGFMDKNPKAGIVAFAGRTKLLADGTHDSKSTLSNIRYLVKLGKQIPMHKDFEKVIVIDGCGFMMRNGLGLKFDEIYSLHHYYDLDISMQARKLGYDCYAANIEAEHWGDLEGSTRQLSSFKKIVQNDDKLFLDNKALFIKKWGITSDLTYP